MTETKEVLVVERASLATRSLALGAILAAPYVDQGTDGLNNIAHRELGQVERHKHAIDDAIYVIDQRLQLIELRAQQVIQDQRAEEQRLADQAEAGRQQQEHERALADAEETARKADEPLPPTDPVE